MRGDTTTRGSAGLALATAALLAFTLAASPRTQRVEPRAPEEGEGPFERLIIRGATLIDGSGAPPEGPVDIVIEDNRIVEVRGVGAPGVAIDPEDRPQGATREIDAHGDWVLPGFIDLHTHAGARGEVENVADATWSYKLWLAHGVTTARGVALGPDLAWGLEQRELSSRNEIVAPRIVECAKRPSTEPEFEHPDLMTPEEGRAWVRYAARMGADCLKLGDYAPGMMQPDVMGAILDEAQQQGLGTTAHLHQSGVAEMNARDMARAGLTGMTHFYGLFESLYRDRDIQDFPLDYNYANEQDRFGQVGRQWYMIHEPGSDEWNALIDEFLEHDFYINPTMTIYEASRDLMRARNAIWHDLYTLPGHWQSFQASRTNHGSYWYYWTTEDEYHWKKFYERWMRFLDDYKDAGGKVTTGSDSCCIYRLHGFGYVRELELLREAGFHPLEVIRAATLHGAQELNAASGEPVDRGLVRATMLADLVIVGENPLENLKVLYGTGARKLDDETGEVERVGGVKYTVKDGIVYDARRLLEDVAETVRERKREIGMDPDAPYSR